MNDERVNVNLGVDIEKRMLKNQVTELAQAVNFWMGVSAVCLKRIGVGIDVVMTPDDIENLSNHKMKLQAKQADDGKSVLIRVISDEDEQKEPVITGEDSVLNVDIVKGENG